MADRITDAELARWQLAEGEERRASSALRKAMARLESAQAAHEEALGRHLIATGYVPLLKAQLWQTYRLGDEDSIDPQTGAIRRQHAPPPPPAGGPSAAELAADFPETDGDA